MEIHEVTTDSLEKLLNQLKKCEYTIGTAGDDITSKTNYWQKEHSTDNDTKDQINADIEVSGYLSEKPSKKSIYMWATLLNFQFHSITICAH